MLLLLLLLLTQHENHRNTSFISLLHTIALSLWSSNSQGCSTVPCEKMSGNFIIIIIFFKKKKSTQHSVHCSFSSIIYSYSVFGPLAMPAQLHPMSNCLKCSVKYIWVSWWRIFLLDWIPFLVKVRRISCRVAKNSAFQSPELCFHSQNYYCSMSPPASWILPAKPLCW